MLVKIGARCEDLNFLNLVRTAIHSPRKSIQTHFFRSHPPPTITIGAHPAIVIDQRQQHNISNQRRHQHPSTPHPFQRENRWIFAQNTSKASTVFADDLRALRDPQTQSLVHCLLSHARKSGCKLERDGKRWKEMERSIQGTKSVKLRHSS